MIPDPASTPDLRHKSITDLTAGQALETEGPLAACLPGYQSRKPQIEMASAIENAIENQSVLVAEAGTGIGKTFAYLAPLLITECKAIISTGTKQLQDQLYNKDLPLLKKALSLNTRAELLKGRANYLCVYRLKIALESSVSQNHENFINLKSIEVWGDITSSGDKSEFSELAEEHPVWLKVTSTIDNCLGQECPYYGDCFVVKARRAAQDADIVVINHHLFCADLALKETGFSELLPEVDTIILDEAHRLPEVATRFFGKMVSSRQLQDLAKDIQFELLNEAPDMPEVMTQAQNFPAAVARFRYALGKTGQKAAWQPMLNRPDIIQAVEDLDNILEELTETLEAIAERGQGLQTCFKRILLQRETLRSMTGVNDDFINWFETTRLGFILHQTPLDISDIFHDHMQSQTAAWVFTSATLAIGEDFSHFRNQLGIDSGSSELWSSPFDYKSNALLYSPDGLPQPNVPDYMECVLEKAVPVMQASPGGCFFLFTSYRALQFAADNLGAMIDKKILVQGEAPRQVLLDKFREDGESILLGTSSFWEGVDVRGKALSCVIIDKLPFASPGDPVLEARLEYMRNKGLNPFMDYQLPQAVISLKQGAGRLIRDTQDKGLLMICDPRLRDKPYGKKFIKSLPPMLKTTDESKVLGFLKSVQESYQHASS